MMMNLKQRMKQKRRMMNQMMMMMIPKLKMINRKKSPKPRL